MDSKIEDNDPTTLQNLPVEMLDQILMKVVLLDYSQWFKTKPITRTVILEILARVMSVWSGWCERFTLKWVQITLRPRIRQLENLFPANPTIVTRQEWYAADPTSRAEMAAPAQRVIIHHSVEPQAFDEDACIRAAQRIQNYHMDVNGWADVGYNFMVGEDGRVYEGRGWNVVGAHTMYFNDTSVGICVVGNFMRRAPNDAALKTLQELIRLGVKKGYIDPDYTLHGHKDLRSNSDSPGTCLYRIIQNWIHYEKIVH